MRTLVVSDLHIGAKGDRARLEDQPALDALRAAAAQADRLVILGDVLELRQRPVGSVLVVARDVLASLGQALGPAREVVIVPGNDPQSAAHVVGLLLRNGIEVTRLRQPLSSRAAHGYLSRGGAGAARTFPAGSYVIDLNQPQRRLAKGMLEPDAQMQSSFVTR